MLQVPSMAKRPLLPPQTLPTPVEHSQNRQHWTSILPFSWLTVDYRDYCRILDTPFICRAVRIVIIRRILTGTLDFSAILLYSVNRLVLCVHVDYIYQ
jgi:hypothetical protein